METPAFTQCVIGVFPDVKPPAHEFEYLLPINDEEWRSALRCLDSVLLHQLTNVFTSFLPPAL